MRFIRSFKLSDWCLQVIIENLNAFINNETIPRKHIDFLFRVYSEEIYRQYSYLNTMTEERALWFLSPHNKKVKLAYLTENVVTRLQVVGSGITSLTLYESFASEGMLNSIICCIPHVTYLNLNSSRCSDLTLLCIQRMCPELVTLNVRECTEVTDKGIEYLCGNQTLRNLDIFDCSVDHYGLQNVLKGLPALQCLGFENLADSLYYIHENEFKTGDYKDIKYNLTEFVYQNMIFCNDPYQVIWAWTVLCPNVKKVYFEFPVNNRVLEMCTKFQNLEELKVKMLDSSIEVKDVLIPTIANNLSKLILSSVEIPIVTLLESFRNLKILFLKDVFFSDFNPEDIKIQETRLDTLALKGTNVDSPPTSYKAVVLLLSLSKNVTKLYLNRLSNISQELFYLIKNSMKKLTFVDLSYSTIGISSINCFFQMPSMRLMYCDLCMGFSLNEDFAIKSALSENCCTVSWRILNDYSFHDYNYDAFSDEDTPTTIYDYD